MKTAWSINYKASWKRSWKNTFIWLIGAKSTKNTEFHLEHALKTSWKSLSSGQWIFKWCSLDYWIKESFDVHVIFMLFIHCPIQNVAFQMISKPNVEVFWERANLNLYFQMDISKSRILTNSAKTRNSRICISKAKRVKWQNTLFDTKPK